MTAVYFYTRVPKYLPNNSELRKSGLRTWMMSRFSSFFNEIGFPPRHVACLLLSLNATIYSRRPINYSLESGKYFLATTAPENCVFHTLGNLWKWRFTHSVSHTLKKTKTLEKMPEMQNFHQNRNSIKPLITPQKKNRNLYWFITIERLKMSIVFTSHVSPSKYLILTSFDLRIEMFNCYSDFFIKELIRA